MLTITISDGENNIIIKNECIHKPDAYEFVSKYVESMIYLSTYQKLNAKFTLLSRDGFVVKTGDMFTMSIVQQVFFHDWEIVPGPHTKMSNEEGLSYEYHRRIDPRRHLV